MGWQYIFFINAPIGIIAIAIELRYLQDTYRALAKIDIVGMLIFGSALGVLSYGATGYAASGIKLDNAVEMAFGAALILVFLVYDHSRKNPTIDFPSFKNKVLRNSVAALFFTCLGLLSGYFFGNHVSSGNKGSFAVERIVASCARLCGWKFS